MLSRLFFIALCCLSITVDAAIVHSPTLKAFEEALVHANEETLVMFDVDETLIVPKDGILNGSREADELWREIWFEVINNSEINSSEMYDSGFLFGQIFSKAEYELVDPKLVSVISSLQQRNIKTIAFTKMFAGQLGAIASTVDWRIAHLKDFGIDFRAAFPGIAEVKIEGGAHYKEGVLVSNGKHKGPVLVDFLEHLAWKPKKILFLDNRSDYLETVEVALVGSGIEFIGYHYTEVEDRITEIDEPLAYFQLSHLVRKGVWLSDREARELMVQTP